MKRYEDLLDDTPDIEQAQKTIEKIFNSCIKTKKDIDKDFEISGSDYSVINTNLSFIMDYVAEYNYQVLIFYDKVMSDRKYFIKFYKEV